MSNKFIREGIEDFDWISDVEHGYVKVDTTKDYMGVWPQFEKMLSKLGVTNLEGYVESDDYEGSCKLLLKSDYFEFEIYANFVYDQDTIETGEVNWSIQNLKKYGYVKSQHSLVTHDWLKPIVNKLREMIINSNNKYKKMNESEDFEWISDIDAKLPTLGELFDDGRLEVDDIITLRGEVVNGRDWKKKWFNEFVIELTSKGERLTSGTFFDLIDTPINNGVSEAMGLSSDFEISFIEGDEKLEVLSVVRNGKEMDLFKLNESDDFDWVRDVDITNHIKPPYFINMKEYGLKPNEYNSTLSKIFNQPVKYGVTVQGYIVYDKQGNKLYRESSVGDWIKREYDEQGNRIYYEDSDGKIKDYRNLNESDDFDWIKDIDVTPIENTGSRCDGTYDLVFDYFYGKRSIAHGDYTYYMDTTSGTVIWEFNDTEDYIVYATPFWEGNCYLPIHIQGDMGDYEELLDMELPEFNYREELFNWLENVYPNIVASAIDDLGPLPE